MGVSWPGTRSDFNMVCMSPHYYFRSVHPITTPTPTLTAIQNTYWRCRRRRWLLARREECWVEMWLRRGLLLMRQTSRVVWTGSSSLLLGLHVTSSRHRACCGHRGLTRHRTARHTWVIRWEQIKIMPLYCTRHGTARHDVMFEERANQDKIFYLIIKLKHCLLFLSNW